LLSAHCFLTDTHSAATDAAAAVALLCNLLYVSSFSYRSSRTLSIATF
jgi:hypothetical protein